MRNILVGGKKKNKNLPIPSLHTGKCAHTFVIKVVSYLINGAYCEKVLD